MPYIDHIYYEESGRGRPVILVHCLALSHEYWLPIVKLLSDRCRTVSFDLRGHGRSGAGDRQWTFGDAAADIAMLTLALRLDRPVLVGYSTGAYIAMAAVLRDPGLYSGLVLVGGFPECSTLPLRIKAGLGLLATKLGLTSLMALAIRMANSAGREHGRAMTSSSRALRPASLRSILAGTLRANVTHRLSDIGQPVLLVYGTGDVIMHPYCQILRRHLPNARTVFFSGCWHTVPTERPADFAQAVAAFLEVVWTEPPVH